MMSNAPATKFFLIPSTIFQTRFPSDSRSRSWLAVRRHRRSFTEVNHPLQ
jgi:hypothetical protein